MKIRQMEAMRAVVRNGTTKDAGREMLMTQSAVSKLVGQLEDELSVELFSRQNGQMVLSPEGRLVFEDVDRIMTIIDEMRGKSRETGALRSGKLRIGTMPALGHGLLPQTLLALRSQYPNLTTVIEETTRARIEEQVLSGYYDLGLVTLPVQSDRLVVTLLGQASAVCVVPTGHPLALKKVITVRDLEDEHVISVDPNTLLRHWTDMLFSETRIRRKLQIQTQTTLLACQLVRQGLGVAIVHPLIAIAMQPLVEYRTFAPKIELQYAVISNGRSASRIASSFTEIGKQVLAERLDQITLQRKES